MEINNNITVGQSSTNTTTQKSSLSINDFLKIMAAEIQNQNPMGGDSGGGSKTDYLSQLAQFTMLEQMNTITDGINQINMLNQVSLIGKEVTIFNGGDNVKGVVEKVKFANSSVILQVNGKDYPIGLMMDVSDGAQEEVVEEVHEEVVE